MPCTEFKLNIYDLEGQLNQKFRPKFEKWIYFLCQTQKLLNQLEK